MKCLNFGWVMFEVNGYVKYVLGSVLPDTAKVSSIFEQGKGSTPLKFIYLSDF